MRWLLVNMVSWCIGLAVGFAIWHIVYYPLIVDENGTLKTGGVIDHLVAASLIGAIVAFGQGLFLRKRMASIWKWMLFSIVGLVAGAVVTKYLNQPMLIDGGCFRAPCFFLLSEWMMGSLRWWSVGGGTGWEGSSFALGGPFAGAMLGIGMALGQVFTVRQRLSIKALWVAASASGLALAFTFNFGTSLDILMVAAIAGLIYGLVTIAPLKYLLRDPALNTVENIAPFRLAVKVIHIGRSHIGATGHSGDGRQTFATVKKPWRLLNAVLFLVAFLAPWVRSCSSGNDTNDTISGFGVTSIMGAFTFETFTHEIFQISAHLSGDWNYIALLTEPLILVGLVCILLYALLYSLLNFRSNQRKHFYVRILMLLAGIVGMGSIILWLKDVNWQKTVDLKDLLWGYWLTWVVLGSSVLFEIVNKLSQDRVGVNIPDK